MKYKKFEIKKVFESLQAGCMMSWEIETINLASLRTRAAELNTAAGYRKFTVSVDRVTNQVRLLHNGKGD